MFRQCLVFVVHFRSNDSERKLPQEWSLRRRILHFHLSTYVKWGQKFCKPFIIWRKETSFSMNKETFLGKIWMLQKGINIYEHWKKSSKVKLLWTHAWNTLLLEIIQLVFVRLLLFHIIHLWIVSKTWDRYVTG